MTNDDTSKTVELPITIKLPEMETSPEIVPPFDENLVLAKSYAAFAVMCAPLACVRAVLA